MHLLPGRQAEIGDRSFNPLLDIPSTMHVDLLVQDLQFPEPCGVQFLLRPAPVFLKQVFDVGEPGSHHLMNREIHGLRNVLGELADDEASLANDLAAVWFQLAGNQLEGGGFPCAIASYQAYTLIRLYREIGLCKNLLVPEFEGDFFKT